MSFSDYLVTDDLTVLLGFIGVSVFLLQSLYKPQPLVHPILLGRQSDVGRVRHPTESAVYRNYGTGLMGRFPLRPDKDVDLVNDFVKSQFESPRILWSTKITNARLNERVAAFGAGISRLLPEESTVLLLLNDSLEFVIADLALAKYSLVSITLSSQKLLSRVLEAHSPSTIIVDADFLPHLLRLIYGAKEHNYKIIMVGQADTGVQPNAAPAAQIINWAQVEADGSQAVNAVPPPSVRPDDPFTLAFFETSSGDLQGVRFTHSNFTSGVTAIRALFPPSIALSTLDTLVSTHSLSTPFGRAVAYTALYDCTCFATCDSTSIYYKSNIESSGLPRNVDDILSAPKFPIPSPTVLNHHSLSPLRGGTSWQDWLKAFLTKESLWDRVLFDGAREYVMGPMAGTMKAIVVSGGPLPDEALTPARISLSVPLINAHIHGSTCGPMFATHAFDLQCLPSAEGEQAHIGAPSVNVEVKLVGVDDAAIVRGNDPKGEIAVRGPPVGTSLSENANSMETEDQGWVQTGEIARVMTNGAFKVVGKKSH
ncbi:hypothetical protein EV363DRAFT_1446732 [Boletus edulis]|nr:hypothetical protein EV363DRAFT_1446732 [Boletus edulis]